MATESRIGDYNSSNYSYETYANFYYSNCLNISEDYILEDRLHCYFLRRDDYGPNTNTLFQSYIKHNKENHRLRGLQCIKHAYETAKDGFCDATYDTRFCLRQTPVNTLVSFPCPEICPYYATPNHTTPCASFAYRFCDSYGRWQTQTNYTECYPYFSMYFDAEKYEKDRHPDLPAMPVDDPFASALLHLSFWPPLTSLLFLTVAILLFRMRNLRCTRVYIHQNLMVAWCFKYLVSVVRANNYFKLATSSSENINLIDSSNPKLQIASVVLENLFHLCGSTWFFIEGLFLQYQISFNVFGESSLKMIHFLLIGWGFPIICTIPWIIAVHFRYVREEIEQREKFLNSEVTSLEYNQFLNNRASWQNVNSYNEQLIIAVPQWIMLFLTIGFLANIVRIIRSKIQVTASDDMEVFKKSSRATVSLMPLFGLGILIQFYSFSEDQYSLLAHVQMFLILIIQNTQGIFISVIYCFCNNEVKRSVRSKFNIFAERHSTAFSHRSTDVSNFKTSLSESLSQRWTKSLKRSSARSDYSRTSAASESDRKSYTKGKCDSVLVSDVYSADSTII